jgi:hypothetical protein
MLTLWQDLPSARSIGLMLKSVYERDSLIEVVSHTLFFELGYSSDLSADVTRLTYFS